MGRHRGTTHSSPDCCPIETVTYSDNIPRWTVNSTPTVTVGPSEGTSLGIDMRGREGNPTRYDRRRYECYSSFGGLWSQSQAVT